MAKESAYDKVYVGILLLPRFCHLTNVDHIILFVGELYQLGELDSPLVKSNNPSSSPNSFPNSDSAIKPAPQTLPESRSLASDKTTRALAL